MTDPGIPTPATGPDAAPSVRDAVLVAAGEETRVLLRGLLRLQHFRVVGEAQGSTDGLELLQQHRPGVVLIEANLSEGSAAELIRKARGLLAGSRIVVVGTLDPEGGIVPDDGSITFLRKPFRIAEFTEAIGAGSTPDPAPPP